MADITAEVLINAPMDRVWQIVADVERWPEWTPTMTRVTRVMDLPGLTPGASFRVEQPKLSPALWIVTRSCATGGERGFTWVSQTRGAWAEADHALIAEGREVRVRLSVRFQGPMGWLLGWFAGGITRAYVEKEAAALKARAEGTIL